MLFPLTLLPPYQPLHLALSSISLLPSPFIRVVGIFLVHKHCCHFPLHLKQLFYQLPQCKQAICRPSTLSQPLLFFTRLLLYSFPNPPTQVNFYQLQGVTETYDSSVLPFVFPNSYITLFNTGTICHVHQFFLCVTLSRTDGQKYHPLRSSFSLAT